MPTYTITLKLTGAVTPIDAEAIAEELLLEAREHVLAGESLELVGVGAD